MQAKTCTCYSHSDSITAVSDAREMLRLVADKTIKDLSK